MMLLALSRGELTVTESIAIVVWWRGERGRERGEGEGRGRGERERRRGGGSMDNVALHVVKHVLCKLQTSKHLP